MCDGETSQVTRSAPPFRSSVGFVVSQRSGLLSSAAEYGLADRPFLRSPSPSASGACRFPRRPRHDHDPFGLTSCSAPEPSARSGTGTHSAVRLLLLDHATCDCARSRARATSHRRIAYGQRVLRRGRCSARANSAASARRDLERRAGGILVGFQRIRFPILITAVAAVSSSSSGSCSLPVLDAIGAAIATGHCSNDRLCDRAGLLRRLVGRIDMRRCIRPARGADADYSRRVLSA